MNLRNQEAGTGEQARTQGSVELRVDADVASLSVIRAVASNLAVGQDFDLDMIADLKLAVDEACSTLITRSVAGETLRCRFRTDTDGISLHASVPTGAAAAPSRESFGWRVLTTLTDSAESWVEEPAGDHGAVLVHVRLVKRKPVAA